MAGSELLSPSQFLSCNFQPLPVSPVPTKRLAMDARQDPTVLQVLSQALKDSQSNATRLQVELDAALAVRWILLSSFFYLSCV